jgi:hypothetical protein
MEETRVVEVHKNKCTEWITGRVTPSTRILFDAVSRARGDPDRSTTVRFMVDEFLAKYVTKNAEGP